MSVEVPYKRQTVVFAVLAVVALAATELAVRYFDDPALDARLCTQFMGSALYMDVPDHAKAAMCREYVGIQYEGDAKVRSPLPFEGTHVNINADGFRGAPLDAFGSDSYMIFMLGGSTTYGLTTVSDDRTIPALLERRLRDAGLDARVVNAGVPGASTLQERYRLEHDIAHRGPDMVITYDGVNEWYIPELSYDEFLAAHGWVEESGLLFPVRGTGGAVNGAAAEAGDAGGAGDPADSPCARESWLLGLGRRAQALVVSLDYRTGIGAIKFLKDAVPLAAVESAPDMQRVDYGPAIERRLRDTWGGMCEAGDRMGFTTVNFLQPHLGTGDRAIPKHEMHAAGGKMIVGLDPTSYVRASDMLATVDLDPAGYPPCRHVHDLRGAFDGMDGVPIYYDWSHMSGSGNDVVAAAMYDVVLPLVLDDLAP